MTKLRRRLYNIFLPAVVFFLCLCPSFQNASFARGANKTFKKTMAVMGTELELIVSVGDDDLAEKAFGAVFDEMTRLESMMSEWKEDSALSKVNRNAGVEPVKVPEELFKLISSAQTVSEITNGAFDATWAAMAGLWDFRPGHEAVPADEEIKKRLPLVDYREVELDPKARTVFLRKKGMVMGLGAIAKGYAVDKGMQAIARMGINDAIIRAGGDMRVQGVENGKPWGIGIRHPRKKGRHIARLPLTDISISTSGDYERFFIKDGTIYHHIMNPKTGYPSRGVQSVTILAPDTTTSDALSTGVFVMGLVEGMKLVERLKGVQAIIVDDNGGVHFSSGITKNQKR